MNAIVSGRSARALILDGESLKSFDLDDPSKIVPRRRSDLPYLFGEAADLRILENTTIESVERELRMDCHFTWALDLTLISLDSELEDDIRKEALEQLEELFAENSTVIRVENVLYSEPLPEEADLTSAFELCDGEALPTVVGFLRRLEEHQSLIEKTNQAWESVPAKTFGNYENRRIFKHTAVKEGLFRNLVILEPSASISTFSDESELKKSVQQLPNHHQVLQAWTAAFYRSRETRDVMKEEDKDSGSAERPFAAIEALIEKHDRPLRLAAHRILRMTMPSETAEVEAEEVLQEIYMDVWMKGIKNVESIGTYLMGMVRKKALGRVRRHLVNVEWDKTLEDVRINLEAEFEKKESSEWLERQISGMFPEDQLILHLSIKGFSLEEMARALDISKNAAKVRLVRARARLLRRAKQNNL